MPYQLPIVLLASALATVFACDLRDQEKLVHGTRWTSLSGEVSGAGRVTIETPGVLVISGEGPGLTAVTRRHDVPSHYTLRFRQRIVRYGAAQGVTVHDGAFRAHLTFSSRGIFASREKGVSALLQEAQLDDEFHDYELIVRDGRGDLYVDGFMLRSFALEPDAGSDGVEHWVQGPLTGTLELDDTVLEPNADYLVDQPWDGLADFVLDEQGPADVAASLLTLTSSEGELARVHQAVAVDPSYEATFAQRILRYGREHGFAVNDGEFRAELLFRVQGVYARESDGRTSLLHPFRDDEASAWHQYAVHTRRIDVAERELARSSLYIDGVFAGEWNLVRDESAPHVEHWLRGSPLADQQVDFTKIRSRQEPSFSFMDRFEREATDGVSDYWMQTSADERNASTWKLVGPDRDAVLESPLEQVSALALLHVFAKDVKGFSGRFFVREAGAAGSVWFNLRRNDERSRIAVHLAVDSGAWSLFERAAENREPRVLATHALGKHEAGWHTFSFSAVGPRVAFELDGQTILSSEDVTHQNYGRIGFQTEDAIVQFDDVLYDGDAPVERGVLEGVRVDDGGLTPVQSASTGLMRQADGTLWLTNTKQTCFLSRDNGLTFRYDGTLGCGTNLLELPKTRQLGRLSVEADAASGAYLVYRELSASGAKCREGPQGLRNPAQCWAPNAKQPLFPDAPRGKLMPGKVTQASSGRVLVATPEPHGEGVGGMRVYYSDDFEHWARSRVVHDFETFGIDLEAGKVVEIEDEHFKLFMRTDQGALFESESYDGGASWTAPARTIFRSPRADFNVERDPVTGRHYMLWQYDDPDERRGRREDGGLDPIPSRGRARLGLAVSLDGTRTWRFLMTLDDWEGHDFRHMNPSLLVHDGVLFVAVARRKYNGTEFAPDVHDLAYFRVDVRDKSGSLTFPGTH